MSSRWSASIFTVFGCYTFLKHRWTRPWTIYVTTSLRLATTCVRRCTWCCTTLRARACTVHACLGRRTYSTRTCATASIAWITAILTRTRWYTNTFTVHTFLRCVACKSGTCATASVVWIGTGFASTRWRANTLTVHTFLRCVTCKSGTCATASVVCITASLTRARWNTRRCFRLRFPCR
jgi:hypothetical protein